MPVVRRLLPALAAVLLGGAGAVGPLGIGTAASEAAPAHAVACSPKAVPEPVRVSLRPLTDESGVRAWDFLRARFSIVLTGDHCAGDAFSIRIPERLVGPDARTYQLRTADGDRVGVMRAGDRTVRVRLGDYVESHHDIQVNGWFDVQIDNSIHPGRTAPITWTVNGATSRTPVHMASCDDCSRMPTRSALWENARTPTRVAQAVLSLPAGRTDGQRFGFTVRAGKGQRFRCPITAKTDRYRHRDLWGDPTDARSGAAASVTSCRSGVVRGSVQVPARAAARAYLPLAGSASAVRQADVTAVITSGGYRQTISTRPPSWAGGGDTVGAADPASARTAATRARVSTNDSSFVGTLARFTSIPGRGFFVLGGIIAFAVAARLVAVFRR